MVLLNLMMVKIVLFIFQKFKVTASKLSTKAKPWNLKRPWVKKDLKPQKLFPNKTILTVYLRQSFYSAGLVWPLTYCVNDLLE
jgi:hypothetical protein